MIKRLFALAAFTSLALNSFAEVRWGQVELTYFKVRGEDGRMIDLPTKGVVLPVRMERIVATPLTPRPVTYKKPADLFAPAATNIYKNDNGDGTYFYDPTGPSAIDDLATLPSGNGQWWSSMTNAVNTVLGNPTAKVMNRQLGWTSYATGRGSGVQAFDNLVFDVGWSFVIGNFPPGTWKYTIPIQNYWAQIPVGNRPRVPSGLIYFAQEWRAWNAFGEGAFLLNDFAPVFSGGGATVGSSEDQYWVDWNPLDGIFAEDEADYFGGTPNEANFLCSLDASPSGVQEVIKPSSVTLFRGKNVGGNPGSFHFIDQNYYKANKAFVANVTENPIQIILEGYVSTANLTSMSVDFVTSFTNNSFDQIVEAYNYTSGTWVKVDQRPVNTTDLHVTIGVPGTASEFVDAVNGNVVKLKVSFKQTTLVPTTIYGCKIDLVNWITSHN